MADRSGQGRIRSFSSSNLHASKLIHEYIANQERTPGNGMNMAREVTKSSMIIPTFNKRMLESNPRLARYTLGLVTNMHALKELEDERVINWCPQARTLVPINTDLDGNCLLHSISVYIWGVHDRKLNLRRFLHRRLAAENRFEGKLYLRWKHQQEKALYEIPVGFDSGEVRRDWDSVVDAASCIEFPSGNRGTKYFPLEDIHVFTVCNIIARPIIVLSERTHHGMDGKSLQPNQISGVYLPLLRTAGECEKSPVVIAYHHGHFMPLLSGEDHNMAISSTQIHQDAQHCIPLLYSDLTDLPIRFTSSRDHRDHLLNTYLDCFNIPIEQVVKPAVFFKFKSPPAWSIELMWSLFSRAQETFSAYATSSSSAASGSVEDKYSVSGSPLDPSGPVYSGNSQMSSPKFTDPSSNRQAPTTSGYQLPEGANAQSQISPRKECLRHSFGCRNFGEEKFNMLCRECYRTHVLERERKPSNEVNGKSDAPMIPKTAVTSGRDYYRGPETVPLPRSRQTETCIISGCHGRGNVEFRDMCRECYSERMSRQEDFHRFDSGSKVENETPSEKKTGKVFCAIPGCQEDIVPGTEKCQEHLDNKPSCISEHCKNKVDGNEVPLCKECITKQQQEAGFEIPSVYPTFNKIAHAVVPTVSSQASYEITETPHWQSAWGRPVPLKTARCIETHCTHFAAPGKDGLCNECFNEKRRLRETPHQGKCRMPACRNPGDAQLGYICYPCYRKVPGATGKQEISTGNDQARPENDLYSGIQRPSMPQDDMSPKSPTRVSQNPSRRNLVMNQTVDRDIDRSMHSSQQPGYGNLVRAPLLESQREASTEAGGFVNQGYQPGMYSMIGGRNQEQKCIIDGCTNAGKAHSEGLCDVCHEQSLEQEKRLLEANQERKRLEATRAEKLPADSPYLHPIPCKTRGCPLFRESAESGYCGSCLRRMQQDLARNDPVNVTSNTDRVSSHSPVSSSSTSSQPTRARDQSRSQEVRRHESGSFDIYRPAAGQANRKCANSFCDFYASGEFGPYCSKCFMEITKKDAVLPFEAGNGFVSNRPLDTERHYTGRGSLPSAGHYALVDDDGALMCRRAGCKLFGRPERNGYCSQCYFRNSPE